MLRLLAVGCLLATASLAAEVDRKDPAAVAAAYADALNHDNLEAIKSLSVREKGVDTFMRIFVAQIRSSPEGHLLSEEGLSELMLFPLNQKTPLTVGPATANGEQRTFQLSRQITFSPKLVLVKAADGTWAVDLRASAAATAGTGTSIVLTMINQFKDVPNLDQAVPDAEVTPWQCLNHLRQLCGALRQYAEEHNNKLPLAAVWQDELEPYLDDTKELVCPDHPKEESSYAFNAELSEKSLGQDWEANRRLPVVVCMAGDKPNMTFKPDDLSKAAGRHGKAISFATANSEGMWMPSDWTFAKLYQENDRSEACMQRLEALGQAALKWAAAHGNTLPKADSWRDDLTPLLPRPKDGMGPLVCPCVAGDRCCFAYNKDVAGRKLSELPNRRKYGLFLEVDPSTVEVPVYSGGTMPGTPRHRMRYMQVNNPFRWQVMLNGSVECVTGATPETATPK